MSHPFAQLMTNPDFQNVYDIHPNEVSQHKKELHLVDVRQPEEYIGELGHIKESRLLVLDQLEEQLNSLPKDQPVVFICRSGRRSAQAAQYAKTQGYENVFNMLGGMILWNQLSLPTTIEINQG